MFLVVFLCSSEGINKTHEAGGVGDTLAEYFWTFLHVFVCARICVRAISSRAAISQVSSAFDAEVHVRMRTGVGGFHDLSYS